MSVPTGSLVAGDGALGGTVADLAEATALLYREARLLDERKLEAWLDLFTADGLYAVPMGEHSGVAGVRPLALVHDDANGRESRVYRLLHTRVYDQDPVSRTIHAVGNVEVVGLDEGGDIQVFSTQVIGEVRPGASGQVGLNTPRVLMARVDHRLRREPDGLRIRSKTVLLLDRSQGLYNLSFLV